MELDESAMMEGATYWQTFQQIIFPMIVPIVITVGVLSFIASYGDFVVARILLKTADKLTVMVGIMLFRSDRFDQDFGVITAGSVMAAIPHHPHVYPASKICHQRTHRWVSERVIKPSVHNNSSDSRKRE